MKVPPWILCLALVALLPALPRPAAVQAAAGRVRAPQAPTFIGAPYRADVLRPVPRGIPAEIRVLPPDGDGWPPAARRSLEERIRMEWVGNVAYGPVHTGLRMWLEYPLVTARLGQEVVVPVISGAALPVRGRLELPEIHGQPKQVVILIDASSSANQRVLLSGPDGSAEYVSVLDAEYRAVDHLLDLVAESWLEIGVVAFGEGTWPIARPGVGVETLRQRIAEFRRGRPRGEGRTDTVCALWTAYDWLEQAPPGMARQIVLLTDGDMPHSGRFSDCRRARRGRARQACQARLNTSICPAQHRLRRGDGRSDLIQMARLGRRLPRSVTVSPVVFEADRSARPYRLLAEQTGGDFVQVPSVQAIEVALPPVVAGMVRGVRAVNLRTGEETHDLLGQDLASFQGELALVPGANDVELRVESDRGIASLYRFRVYSEARYLGRYLDELRRGNRALEARSASLVEEVREMLPAAPRRDLEVTVED